jgi:hypothetical protein
LRRYTKEAEREVEEEERQIRPTGVAGLDLVRTTKALETLRLKHGNVSKAILELVREVSAVERAYEDCKSTVGACKSRRCQPPKVIFRVSAANPRNFRYKFRIIRPNPHESTRKFIRASARLRPNTA